MLAKVRDFWGSLNKKNGGYRAVQISRPRRLVITENSLIAIRECMLDEIAIGHEGIAYLFGQTNGESTLIVGAIRPDAQTTRGSFDVSALAMARIVRKATDAGLQVVGQIHTHPGKAYHSDGDIEGARIAYDGYVSMVIPEYGRALPSLVGAVIFFYRDGAFSILGMTNLRRIREKF